MSNVIQISVNVVSAHYGEQTIVRVILWGLGAC